MAIVMERTEGRYEVREAELGKAYRWCPECVVIECDCGARPTLNRAVTTCECGADHATIVREELADRRGLGDEVLHPWRYVVDREDTGIPY